MGSGSESYSDPILSNLCAGCYPNNDHGAFGATPLSVASTNRRDKNNAGWVRRCSESNGALGLTVDEDADTDSERNHTTESAGIIAGSTAFHANFDVDLLVSKNSVTFNDPINLSTNSKTIPDADVEYTIGVVNRDSTSPDLDTVIITDDIPVSMRLCVTTACLTRGPVIFDDSGSPVRTGLSLGAVEYSNDGGTSYAYTPVPDGDGLDIAANAVCINPDGVLTTIAPAGSPSFELRFAAGAN